MNECIVEDKPKNKRRRLFVDPFTMYIIIVILLWIMAFIGICLLKAETSRNRYYI